MLNKLNLQSGFAVLFFIAISFSVSVNASEPYAVCNEDYNERWAEILQRLTVSDLKNKKTAKEFFNDILISRNKLFSDLLEEASLIGQAKFVSEVKQLLMLDPPASVFECFFQKIDEKDDVYDFEQSGNNQLTQGVAVVRRGKIVLVLYSRRVFL